MRINLTKKQIVNSIYMQIGFSKKISETLLEVIFQIILNNIISGNMVIISKFGTFYLHKSPARIGRNPKTKEEFKIPASEKLAFKASNKVKSVLN